MLALSQDHGVDLGDLLAMGLGAVAVGLTAPALRRWLQHHRLLADTSLALASLGLLLAITGLLDFTRANRHLGSAYDLAAPLAVAAAGAWVVLAAASKPRPWPRLLRATVPGAGLVLLAGLLVDAAATPSGTLFGPSALAVHLAARSPARPGRVVFALLAAAMLAVSAASLGDVAGTDVLLSRSGGGGPRSLGLGVVLLVGAGLGARARLLGNDHHVVEPGSAAT